MVFTADRGIQIIYSDLFASTFVFQTVSSTDNKRQQEKRHGRQNFHFLAKISLATGLYQKDVTQLSSKNRLQLQNSPQTFTFHKQEKDPPGHPHVGVCQAAPVPLSKNSPRPQHSSNPLQAPPARIFSSSSPPCWLAGWPRVGGPPFTIFEKSRLSQVTAFRVI